MNLVDLNDPVQALAFLREGIDALSSDMQKIPVDTLADMLHCLTSAIANKGCRNLSLVLNEEGNKKLLVYACGALMAEYEKRLKAASN